MARSTLLKSAVCLGTVIAASGAAAADCLPYGQPVTITGYYGSVLFPGIPNYESVKSGDEPERVPMLFLDVPICTGEDPEGIGEPVPSIAAIQLACSSEEIDRFSRTEGDPMTVRGSLFAGHTGHHHTAVLLSCS
jgi:hypothetical protein